MWTLAGTGLLTGLALIVAIGAQNAFVLRQGVRREHVGAVVLVCMASDAVLILAGTAGVGALVQAVPWLLEVLRWGGALYLLWFAVSSLRAALRPAAVRPSPAHASCSSTRMCRATRTRPTPASVGSQGVPRRSSTWPTSRSRARMRWLTAEALTPSSYAAASNEPSSAIERSACS